MRRSPLESARARLLLGALGLALAVTQSGCPDGGELENADAWAGRFGTGGGNTTGTGGTGVTGGIGGTGVMGPVLDFSKITCVGTTPQDFLIKTCAINFCHGPTHYGDLDLRPDDAFAQRTLDVPATFTDYTCPGTTTECIPDSCPPAGTVKFIDSTDPAVSWILTKARHEQAGCGDPMPTKRITADQDACLTEIVNATAALK